MANLVTVILVGVAIAFAHHEVNLAHSSTGSQLAFASIFGAVGLGVIAAGTAYIQGWLWGLPQRSGPLWRVHQMIGWCAVLVGSLVVAETVLFLTGLAAGVK